MNVPNQLTVLRLALSFVFAAVLSVQGFVHAGTVALIVFAGAAFTDFLDGYLARKHGLITNFGKLMDPLADKVLMCAGFVLLCERGHIPAWIVVVILTREFLVTGLRLLASAEGKVLAAEALGKYKTTIQIVTVLYFLLFLASREPGLAWTAPLFDIRVLGPGVLGWILIGLSLVLTLLSGLSYVWKNRAILRDM